MSPLQSLLADVVACERCPRLRTHCAEVARVKRRAYRDEDYWGRPVPSFGDPTARLLIVGLAPGAHGANRTGRMFTGDRSGDFLYKVLHETGFASQASSRSRDDGLILHDAWITAAVRCAPPGNKPSTGEFRTCRSWLAREIDLMPEVRVVVALGKLAFDAYLAVLRERGVSAQGLRFGHDVLHRVEGPALISSYHPSQQNTQTGRLTEAMLRSVFRRAQKLLAATSATGRSLPA